MVKSCSFLLALLLAVHPPGGDQKDKHSGHLGSLVITATAILEGEKGKTDPRHYVVVFVNIKNTGKNPACASFSTKLKTTYGLEYSRQLRFFDADLARLQRRSHVPDEPRVYEMLPGEQSNGAYVFTIKNGVEPLEMTMNLSGRRGIRCGSARDSFGDVFPTEEIKLDVHDLPAPKTD